MDFNNVKLYDAHLHLKNELELEEFLKCNIVGVLSINKQNEYEKYFNIQNENLIFSMGIHPWYADRTHFLNDISVLEKAKIIGEIGLDNIWCDVDINIQKEVFEKQLKYASENKKPVILHTKGMEKEVLELIKKYDNKYLVHWYSSFEHVDEYINLGCYFTIGPSVLWDKVVINLAKKAPIDKLLIETDGLTAVIWAYEALNYTKDINYKQTLINSISKISEIRNISLENATKCIENNFKKFYL